MASRTARKGTSRYKIRNWKQYEAGLIQRGSISFWINDDGRCCIKRSQYSKDSHGWKGRLEVCFWIF